MTRERDYQELYDRLLEEVSTLHRNNRRRIRVGMRMLLAVTLGLMLLMFLAGGNKVFTLMLWILSMFAVAAYLIAVEYADYELQKKLENITQMEQESLGTLLELPELPKVPRMGLLLRHGTREEQETPETEATAAEAAPAPEETPAAEEISPAPAEETPVTKAPAAPEPEAYSVDEILREVHGGAPQADNVPAAPVYSGARVLECACGPCIGMGFSPNSGGVSLRTFNRNFLGRSGTRDGQVYLVSPETAVASALTGYITDPTTIDQPLHVTMPEKFLVNDSAVLPPLPADKAADAEVLRGPNIKEFPKSKPFADSLTAKLVLKVGDNITTDHIMPAGAKILPYRSNIPYLSKFCFEVCDPTFAERAKAAGDGIVVGGSNYGQGSSREHAALVPMYLGIRCVIAKSFARIHVANLINAGILPVTFENPEDYDKLNQDAVLTISDIASGMEQGRLAVTAGDGFKFYVNCALTERQRAILMAGGLLNYTKEGGQ